MCSVDWLVIHHHDGFPACNSKLPLFGPGNPQTSYSIIMMSRHAYTFCITGHLYTKSTRYTNSQQCRTMMTSSNGNISTLLALCVGNSPVTSEFPSQRPVTWSFDIFFDLCLRKRLSTQLRCWWFEVPSCPLWRHCNVWFFFTVKLQKVFEQTVKRKLKWDTLTHWPFGNADVILNLQFQTYIKDNYLENLMWNCSQVDATRPHWWWLNIGSGNGLVLSGTKPLPEPMLAKFYDAIWHH